MTRRGRAGAEGYTGVPVTQERAAVRKARDRYLRHTLDTFYVNQAMILERLGADKVQPIDASRRRCTPSTQPMPSSRSPTRIATTSA